MPQNAIPLDCETCPNRKTVMGKGYAFLFSIAITGLLCWQSVDVKYSKSDGWEMQSRDVPIHVLLPSLFLVAGALGLQTDSIAIALGNILTSGRRVD